MRVKNLQFVLTISAVMVIIPLIAHADFYFVSECGNNGDGTSWKCAASDGGAGAFNDIPKAGVASGGYVWQRGVTYWIAGSRTEKYMDSHTTFSGFRYENGTGRIIIRKATPTDHGTDIGWKASYGTETAVINGELKILVNDVTIDGSYRTGLESGHGIKFEGASDTAFISTMNNREMSGLELRYIEMTHTNVNENSATAIALHGSGRNTIQYMNIHNVSGLCLKGNIDVKYTETGGFEDLLFEESVCGAIGKNTAAWHVELMKDDGHGNGVIIRNNLFYDWRSTGGIFLSASSADPTTQNDWLIYNNLFTQREAGLTCGTGILAGDSSETGWRNIRFFNNTIANVSSLYAGVFAKGTSDMSAGGNIAQNNLFYNLGVSPQSCGAGATCRDNWYYNVEGYTPNSNEISGKGGDPFVDSTHEDFRLAADADPVDQGISLSRYFTVDRDGVPRPTGAAWDIGAYEFSGDSAKFATIPKDFRKVSP